jgi:hypothetical protein
MKNHEITKGVLPVVEAAALPRHRNAGWAFANPRHRYHVWVGEDGNGDPIWELQRATATNAGDISLEEVIERPLFKRFNPDSHKNIDLWREDNWFNPFSPYDGWMYLPDNDPEVSNRLPMFHPYIFDDLEKIKVWAKLMAEMIPPLSSPAGGMRLIKFTETDTHRAQNLMSAKYRNTTLWPATRPKVNELQYSRWLHSDYKDAPLLLTYPLYVKIKEITQGNLP